MIIKTISSKLYLRPPKDFAHYKWIKLKKDETLDYMIEKYEHDDDWTVV